MLGAVEHNFCVTFTCFGSPPVGSTLAQSQVIPVLTEVLRAHTPPTVIECVKCLSAVGSNDESAEHLERFGVVDVALR